MTDNGVLKRAWTGIKKEVAERKEAGTYKRAAAKESRKRAQAAYYKARAEQQEKYAITKARVERESQEKKLKAKYAPKPKGAGFGSSFFEGINLGVSQQPRTSKKSQPSMGFSQEPYFKSGGLIAPLFQPAVTKVSKPVRRKKRN